MKITQSKNTYEQTVFDKATPFLCGLSAVSFEFLYGREGLTLIILNIDERRLQSLDI